MGKYQYITEAVMVEGVPLDDFGERIGIPDKSDSDTINKMEQPIDGPIGDISKSAYANVNVPTRSIPRTDNGNLACAAAVSVMFYRATGYSIIPGKKIELSTGNMWDYLDGASDRFQKITNWSTDYQPGDIIITRRGSKPGHVGIVVDDGKIVSNSSGGFQGDNKGQIELNYTISSWSNVANRNRSKTAIFRYIGPYRDQWGGEGVVKPKSEESRGSTAEDSEIEYGSTGQEVVKLQKALISSGYDLPKYGVDGKFFGETRKALKSFQKSRGLDETGRLDSNTREQLFIQPESEQGQQLTDVIGKKFKIFDNNKNKIVIAKVEKDGTITIKKKVGGKLGSAKMVGDRIIVEYDGEEMEATEQSENQVARSIFKIFNRVKGAIITGPSQTSSQTSSQSAPSSQGSDDFIDLGSSVDRDLVAKKGAQIANRLTRDLGISKETAAGIVGNLWKESGLIPDRIQGKGVIRGTITEAGSGGYGWAQWTFPTFKLDFVAHARSKGIDLTVTPANDDVSYSYLIEWISSDATGLKGLRSTGTTREAAEYFVRRYEKPYVILNGSQEEQNKEISERTDYANLVLPKMDGSAPIQDQGQPLASEKPKVLFLGDSETLFSYSYANDLIRNGDVTGKIVAQAGANTYILRNMLRDELLKGEKYDSVSILAGGNDGWRDQPADAINNLRSMYKMVKDAGMKVVAISNPTRKFAETSVTGKKKYPSNDEIAKWIEAGGDGLIDKIIPINSRTSGSASSFSNDKVHLSQSGHDMITSLWKESVLA